MQLNYKKGNTILEKPVIHNFGYKVILIQMVHLRQKI